MLENFEKARKDKGITLVDIADLIGGRSGRPYHQKYGKN